MRWVYGRTSSSTNESNMRISASSGGTEKHVSQTTNEGGEEAASGHDGGGGGDEEAAMQTRGMLEDSLDALESAAETESFQRNSVSISNTEENAAAEEKPNTATGHLPVGDAASSYIEASNTSIAGIEDAQAVDTVISSAPATTALTSSVDTIGTNSNSADTGSKRFGFIYDDYNAWVQRNLEKRMQEIKSAEKSGNDGLDPVPALTPDNGEDCDDPAGGSVDGNEDVKGKFPKETGEEEQDKLLQQGNRTDEEVVPAVVGNDGTVQEQQEHRPFSHKFNVDQIWGDLCGYYGMELVEKV